MYNTNTDLQQLRDRLLEKRALQQQAKDASDKAISNFASLVTDYVESFGSSENSVEIVKYMQQIDFDRLHTDEAYVAAVKEQFKAFELRLQKELEGLLND